MKMLLNFHSLSLRSLMYTHTHTHTHTHMDALSLFFFFLEGMEKMGLSFDAEELRILFNTFDKDRNGSIDFEEFLAGIRETLSDSRLDLVEQAFAFLDTEGDGLIDADTLATMFDASNHPDVLGRKRTVEEVQNEFLNTFDVGGVVENMVTRPEFVTYYTNLRCVGVRFSCPYLVTCNPTDPRPHILSLLFSLLYMFLLFSHARFQCQPCV